MQLELPKRLNSILPILKWNLTFYFRVLVLDTPEYFYSIMGLDIIDNKAYIKYSEGEESMVALGTIIDLD